MNDYIVLRFDALHIELFIVYFWDFNWLLNNVFFVNTYCKPLEKLTLLSTELLNAESWNIKKVPWRERPQFMLTSSSFWPPDGAFEDSPSSSLPVREITSGLSRLDFCVGGFFFAVAVDLSYSSTCIIIKKIYIFSSKSVNICSELLYN